MVKNHKKVLAPDQLKDISNGVVTMFSSTSDDEHVIIHMYRF